MSSRGMMGWIASARTGHRVGHQLENTRRWSQDCFPEGMKGNPLTGAHYLLFVRMYICILRALPLLCHDLRHCPGKQHLHEVDGNLCKAAHGVGAPVTGALRCLNATNRRCWASSPFFRLAASWVQVCMAFLALYGHSLKAGI